MYADEFDGYVASDAYFISDIYITNQRILVLRDLQDHTNRELADIVVFFKEALASVLCNKYGPPNRTYPIAYITLPQLFDRCPCCPPHCCCFRKSIYDMFVGESCFFDFRQFLPSPEVWPPNRPIRSF